MRNNKCFLTMPAEVACAYKFSKYNIYLEASKGLVYNSVSQAVSMFENPIIDLKSIPELIDSGFIVPVDTDELSEIRKEYDEREQLSREFHLIIATTLDCQFRCFYCYESHSNVYMNEDVKQAIINLVSKQAMTGKNISIVWYGGEPMLDFDSVHELTRNFIEACNAYGVNYRASMISNGYLFTQEHIAELDTLKIQSVQVTVDGMKEVHERRRPLSDGGSSFERIIQNMKNIKEKSNAEVHLRINVDKSNLSSAYELIQYCADIGLNDIDVNLGMMKEFGCSHLCGNLNPDLFTMREFSDAFLKFRDFIEKVGFESTVRKMTPEYKINSCTMDAPNAYVIDPYGWVYKCISQAGQIEQNIGNVLTEFDENAHMIYNPFLLKKCVSCKFFPICKGGCLLNNSGRAVECNVWSYITKELILREISNFYVR